MDINRAPTSNNNQSSKELIASLNSLVATNQRLSKQMGLGYSFLRGIVSGLGSTLGLAIVLALIIFILQQIGVLDFFKPVINSLRDLQNP